MRRPLSDTPRFASKIKLSLMGLVFMVPVYLRLFLMMDGIRFFHVDDVGAWMCVETLP